MQAFALVGFKRWFLCEALLALRASVFIDRGLTGFAQFFLAIQRITTEAGAMLHGPSVLNQ